MIARLRVVPYSRGLLVVRDVVIDDGNPKTVCRPSHTDMMKVVRGGAANGALEISLQASHLFMVGNHHLTPFLKLLWRLLLAGVLLGSDADK